MPVVGRDTEIKAREAGNEALFAGHLRKSETRFACINTQVYVEVGVDSPVLPTESHHSHGCRWGTEAMVPAT